LGLLFVDEVTKSEQQRLAEVQALRKQVESLQGFRELHDKLVKISPDGILTVDLKGFVYSVNDAFVELTGYDRADIEGKHASQLPTVRARDIPMYLQILFDILRGKPMRPFEFVYYTKDGVESWGEARGCSCRLDDNRVGALLILRDITNVKQTDEALRQAQKMETIGKLAGGVAHDMNNVLSAIMSLASLLREEFDDADPKRSDVEDILRACTRGQDLTSNLLGFARKGKTRHELFSIHETVEEICSLLRRTLPKTIRLETRLEATVYGVQGDPGQISQSVMNLCINAVDAMGQEGVLTVSTRNAAASDAPLDPAERIELRVTDTGQGMDEATLRHACEPFFTTKPAGEGTGLGLSMVYGTIANHDGHLALESSPGKGTTATIQLPAVPHSAAPVVAPHRDAPARGQGEGTILIVDDEAMLRQVGKRILEGGGYSVLCAKDGLEALETYRQHRAEVSLVVLDLVMPRLDGAQTFDELRRLDPDLRVVIASGYSRDSKVEALIQSGAVDFIQKPYDHHTLLEAVNRALPEE
jgi:two-component system cell cycle sensor histidine kinase/response regulator CckA